MKALLTILFLGSLFANAQNVRHNLTPAGDGGVYINGNSYTYAAGDTFVVNSAYFYKYISLENFTGTAAKPLVIINGGAAAQSYTRGFDFSSCKYIKLTGTGSGAAYGIVIQDDDSNRDNVGVSINHKSKNIEMEWLLLTSCNTGMQVKNEANCDTSVNSWLIDSITSHNNYYSDMVNQGDYWGTTDPNNDSRPIVCDGVTKYYAPGRLSHIKIYNNTYRRTGRAAIQLSVGTGSGNEIYNNDIELSGTGKDNQQGSGIAIGNYTSVYVHHNNVRRTYGYGISALGFAGELRIENNTIDSSGAMNGFNSGFATGIVVDTRTTIPVTPSTFIVKNNTIGWVQTTAAGFSDQGDIYIGNTFNTYTATGNIICQNLRKTGVLASIYALGGVTYTTNCTGAYIRQYSNTIRFRGL